MTSSTNITGLSHTVIRRGLRWVLLLQAALAAALVLSDVSTRLLPQFGDDDTQPSGPVTPGDRVRHYDPQTLPEYTERTSPPEIELPADLPSRLEFKVINAGEHGELVLINGPIEPGDAQRFSIFLAGMGTSPDKLALNSPGGVVREALAIGRNVRKIEADTIMLPGTACFSACPYILAGGVKRTVSAASAIGMHQHFYEEPGYVPVFFAVENIQRGQGQTLEYLIEMGIDPRLMIHSLNTPPDEIYLLEREELLDSQLATEILN